MPYKPLTSRLQEGRLFSDVDPLQFGLEDPPFQVGNSRADMESFPVLIDSEPGGFQHPSLNVSQEVS
jgi:hypothetical protein